MITEQSQRLKHIQITENYTRGLNCHWTKTYDKGFLKDVNTVLEYLDMLNIRESRKEKFLCEMNTFDAVNTNVQVCRAKGG